jgi:hypothetical protein
MATELIIPIETKGVAAVISDFNKVEKGAANLAKGILDAGNRAERGAKAFQGLGATLGKLGLAGLGISALTSAVSGFTDAIGAASKAAADDAASMGRLNTTLRNAIPDWQSYTGLIDASIAAGQRKAFSDDAQRTSLELLVGKLRDVPKALEFQATAMDLAAAKQITLEQATKALIRADDESIGALRKLGIAVSDQATAEENLAAVRAQVAGQAEIYANTQAGATQRIADAWGELQETVGYAINGVIGPALTSLADWMQSPAFQAGLNELVTNVQSGAQQIGTVLTGLWTNVVQPTWTFIQEHAEETKAVVVAMFAAWAIAATAAAAPTLVALAPVIVALGAVALAVGALRIAWEENFLGIREANIKSTQDILHGWQIVGAALVVLTKDFEDRINQMLMVAEYFAETMGVKSEEAGVQWRINVVGGVSDAVAQIDSLLSDNANRMLNQGAGAATNYYGSYYNYSQQTGLPAVSETQGQFHNILTSITAPAAEAGTAVGASWAQNLVAQIDAAAAAARTKVAAILRTLNALAPLQGNNIERQEQLLIRQLNEANKAINAGSGYASGYKPPTTTYRDAGSYDPYVDRGNVLYGKAPDSQRRAGSESGRAAGEGQAEGLEATATDWTTAWDERNKIAADAFKAMVDGQRASVTTMGQLAQELVDGEFNRGKVMRDLWELHNQAIASSNEELAATSLHWFEQIRSGAAVDFGAMTADVVARIEEMKNSGDPLLAAMAYEFSDTWDKMKADQAAAGEKMVQQQITTFAKMRQAAFEEYQKMQTDQIASFAAQRKASFDHYTEQIALFESFKNRRPLYNTASFTRTGDTDPEKYAEIIGNTPEARKAKAAEFAQSLLGPLMQIADPDLVLPTDEQIDRFIERASTFVAKLLDQVEGWKDRWTPVVERAIGGMGTVGESISKIFEPLLKAKDVQAITPEQIEGSMANLWLLLHHLNEVMKSGELQGDWQARAAGFATTLSTIFTAIKDSLSGLTALTDLKVEGSVGALWAKAWDYTQEGSLPDLMIKGLSEAHNHAMNFHNKLKYEIFPATFFADIGQGFGQAANWATTFEAAMARIITAAQNAATAIGTVGAAFTGGNPPPSGTTGFSTPFSNASPMLTLSNSGPMMALDGGGAAAGSKGIVIERLIINGVEIPINAGQVSVQLKTQQNIRTGRR